MKFSELIAAYGDDKVQFQKLDECASDFSMGKRGTKITFVTDEPFSIGGTEKLGLVLWLDRERVKEIITPKANPHSLPSSSQAPGGVVPQPASPGANSSEVKS